MALLNLKAERVTPPPIITSILCGGRNKNFQVSMIFQLKNHENKILLSDVFFDTLSLFGILASVTENLI